MTDMTTATEEARVISESEASRDVMANAAPDNPDPEAPAASGPLPDSSLEEAEGTRDETAERSPLDRITTADRSRADIAARFKEKRAAAGGQVEFHGDMRDPSQTYAGFAPQGQTTEDGGQRTDEQLQPAQQQPTTEQGQAALPSSVVSPPPSEPQPRLMKVKVHGREAWLPEDEVVAEAQKSLAAGNLLESAKEVLAGARGQTTDDAGQRTDETSDPSSVVRPPSSDPYLALAQTLQLEDAAAAGNRLKHTIESETARARQEASREAARQVRIENELAVSQKALAAFEQTHPQLAADDFARDAITTQVQREINADLQAAVNQGILKELPRTQDERNGLHTQLRAFGAEAARPIGDLFAAAGTKYQAWRGGTPTPVAQPQIITQPGAPGAPRVELTTARQERRAQIVTQPTNGTAPPRGLSATPELTTAQRRSAAVMAMRKARGQIVA
jgi:hypothetical protein